ncbi:MAG: FkbM family methyltransferase, partial [Parvularculaceae bacterium]|nr:FkbM family methyltransferase [Parvularculaceae bacterium]
VRFAPNARNRGMSRADESGAIEVEARALFRLLSDWAPPRVDALKIDIEGAELDVLAAFFRAAPDALKPFFLIAEISHEARQGALASLLSDEGYAVSAVNRLNLVARRAGAVTRRTD